MKNKYIAIGASLLSLTLTFSSCNDFLDELPDNRTELTENNVTQLLLAAYKQGMPCEMYEMYSDNTDAYPNRYSSFNRLQEDMYKWEDTSQNDSDSPYAVWEYCYMGIAACNQVLATIEQASNPAALDYAKGEALVCRAFNHFLLATTFCKMYGPNASTDLGIPYMCEVETTVSPKYERGTLEEVYRNIANDLEAGIPLLDDSKYSIPKYHFTRNAAYAFAARFYLNYMQQDFSNCDKVIEYATKVLGNNPSMMLRDWQAMGELSVNGTLQPNEYVDVNRDANLLLICNHSYWGYIHGPYGLGERYAHGPNASYETSRSSGPWGNFAAGSGNIYYLDVFSNSSALPTKIITRKIAQYFEILDAVAGTGYGYQVNATFTTDDLILTRAEAYALKKNYSAALEDLNCWMAAYTKNKNPLTINDIDAFYGTPQYNEDKELIYGMEYYTPTSPTVKKELHPSFTIESGHQESLIHCILHARRITTLHEGLRWLDIKRYGITIYRRLINSNGTITVTDQMDANDERRAIQIPSDVISAGIQANPRNK